MIDHRMPAFSLVAILFLLSVVYSIKLADGKKKVVIVGEMSDLLANETSRVDEYYEDYEDYSDDLNHNRMRRGNHGSRHSGISLPTHIAPYVKKKSQGPVFVPVAAYSVTKTKKKPSRSHYNSYRKRQGAQIRRNPTAMASKHTESAVYGYMQRPEIIEFRGQYFYGPRPGETDATTASPNGARHPAWDGSMDAAQTQARPAITNPAFNPLNPLNPLTGGLGPGSLLLATLPLILAPMLSYLFTPMIIPITATVAAGRRKRDTFNYLPAVTRVQSSIEPSVQKLLNDASFATKSAQHTRATNEWQQFDRLDDSRIKEAQVVAKYLSKVQFDEKATTRAVANYLQCDGMLADSDHCIERLSCEFSDPSNADAPQLDRAVTSIILSHILANEYITESFKVKLKYAAVYGKDHSGKCGNKFECSKVE